MMLRREDEGRVARAQFGLTTGTALTLNAEHGGGKKMLGSFTASYYLNTALKAT
jgi:hypothetical protein